MVNQIMFVWDDDNYAVFFDFNKSIHGLRHNKKRPSSLVVGTGKMDDRTKDWIYKYAIPMLSHDGEVIFEEE